jgi:hypothetical protein
MQGVLLSVLVAIADVSVTVPPAPSTMTVRCGGRDWRGMLHAVQRYCSDEAAPSEALGCRVALYAFSECAAAPMLAWDDQGHVSGSIRDPRDRSYAWMMGFALHGTRWVLERFRYDFDDCDAMGVPALPRGKLRLRDLRRGPDDRD